MHQAELQNWFALNHTDEQFAKHLAGFTDKPGLRFLQIGVYAGDATMWLFEHILTDETSLLYDVDPWIVDPADAWDDMIPKQRIGAEACYDERTAELRDAGRLAKRHMTSRQFFRRANLPLLDFAYIDGDHSAAYALEDGVDAWRWLKVGGLLAFDDYGWKHPVRPGILSEPTIAIDAFLSVYADKIELLEPVGTAGQVWVRRCR